MCSLHSSSSKIYLNKECVMCIGARTTAPGKQTFLCSKASTGMCDYTSLLYVHTSCNLILFRLGKGEGWVFFTWFRADERCKKCGVDLSRERERERERGGGEARLRYATSEQTTSWTGLAVHYTTRFTWKRHHVRGRSFVGEHKRKGGKSGESLGALVEVPPVRGRTDAECVEEQVSRRVGDRIRPLFFPDDPTSIQGLLYSLHRVSVRELLL